MRGTNKWKKIFNFFLFAMSISVIVYFCVDNNNLGMLIESLPSLNKFWIIVALGSMLLFWFLDSRVIYLITESVYEGKYKAGSAFRITMVGQFYNSISPYGILGQPMQIVSMIRQGISAGIVFSILVQKFLIYQTTLACYSLFVILTQYAAFSQQFENFMLLALLGFLIQSFTVFLLILFSASRKLTTKIIDICCGLLGKLHILKDSDKVSDDMKLQLEYYLNNNKALIKNKKLSVRLYFLTFLQITTLFIIPFYVYKAFNNPGMPVIDIISAQAFVNMIASYIPLPGGSGASEGSFIVLFNMFFVGDVTNQAMLLWRFITYYLSIIVGMFFAVVGKKHEKIEFNVSEIIKGDMNA